MQITVLNKKHVCNSFPYFITNIFVGVETTYNYNLSR